MNNPLSLLLPSTSNHHILPIKGQGVFLFRASSPCSFHICDSSHTQGLHVAFENHSINVKDVNSGQPYIDITNKNGLSSKPGAYHWFSLDAQNQKLLAGIGEPRFETVVYRFSGISKQFLEALVVLSHTNLEPIKLLRDPITKSVPLRVKPTNELSMDDVASGQVLPKANLAIVAQKLYDCISGKQFVLNDPSFPEFSEAIENSIRDPSGWCYQRLQQKASEFSKDKPNPLETYLRITLGNANGESPGVPYVMEIWPPGHYSPIHSHANAHAIIRVLHGIIHVSLYPFLCQDKDGVRPFSQADFVQDEITWISPTLNQTHKLLNQSATETCVTIQCYCYGGKDRLHYDFFDYVDSDGNQQQYEPDSDMDFVEFKNLMKTEFNALSSSVSL